MRCQYTEGVKKLAKVHLKGAASTPPHRLGATQIFFDARFDFLCIFFEPLEFSCCAFSLTCTACIADATPHRYTSKMHNLCTPYRSAHLMHDARCTMYDARCTMHDARCTIHLRCKGERSGRGAKVQAVWGVSIEY